ncbi:MAG: LexA family transcriptional regulator [Bacteroidetes bacterium]|nr:LexA family transcriptional regulator [Bacteroidota bacterium]
MKTPIENIEVIRRAKNLSREDVAKKLGVNLSAYGKIERGESKLTLERLYELATIFRMQPEEILIYNKSKKGNVTYVPIEAQAGFLTGHSQEYLECKTYHLPFIEGKDLYMIDAIGDSMYPTISPGDHIVIEHIEDPKTLQYGRAYVLVAKEGCVIKRIHSHESPKKFMLKSDNLTYEPYEISKDDIISIWLVKNYLLRTNLAPKNPIMFAENISPQQQKKTSK